jgi:flagellar hook protein FlgE
MMRSLYAGISGLRNFQTKMDIIGNNISNVNTVAFKSGRITFAETMAQSLAGEIAPSGSLGGVNPIQVGLGMRTLGVDTNFSQGSMEATGMTTDLAIQGDGFFMVSDGDRNYYSRAGAFQLDADGNMVNAGNGYRVLGYMPLTEGTGILDRSAPQPITIPLGRRSPARSTTEVKLTGNIDMHMTRSTASLQDAGTTGIRNLNGVAFDGVGGVHNVEITGTNATQSIASGRAQGLNLTDNLGTLGIQDLAGFRVNVDGTRTVDITGLTTDSTVSELLHAINAQVAGVKAELDANGAIQLTRNFSGDGSRYNVTLTDSGNSNVVDTLFNQGGTFEVNNGTASTLVAVDNFTPTGQETPIIRALNLEMDDRTGLVNGIADLGGGGVFINAPNGLSAGTAVINTQTTDHSSSIFVYDSLGNTHNLTIRMTRSEEPGVWRWRTEVEEPAVVVEGGTGTISFRDDGSLESFSYERNLNQMIFNPGNGGKNVEISLNVGSFGGFDGLTSTSSATTMMATGQDGFGMGTLQGIFIDTNGQIFGSYSNGETEVLSQLLLANFTNPQGLERVGENLYTDTSNSGAPRVTDADQAGAKINSGYLEMSNVDLSREFTDMILVQRAFQASAKVISTSDGLLEVITSLKR